MSILTILYWVILVISVIFGFVPPTSPIYRWGWLPWVALFIIIGIKLFSTPLK